MTDVDGLDDDAIRALLTSSRRWAVVGASVNPARPSFGVAGFLVQASFEVTPVNPGHAGTSLHGRPVAASLDDAAPLEVVDVFREASAALGVVRDVIRIGGARAVWMQLGVINEAAAAEGRAAGLVVVMDRCPKIEWRRLGLHAAPHLS
jgi:predicted CoA-binding protein